MEHILYADGNEKRIAWAIKTEKILNEQFRDHVDTYVDKVSKIQSKYIALHVSMFWGIGVFIIKNHDTIRMKLDSAEMIKHLSSDFRSHDMLAEHRKRSINQLATQRNLNLIYESIKSEENMATKML